MAMKVLLQDGMYVIVDDEDYERVNKYKWSKAIRFNVVRISSSKHNSLARFILNIESSEIVVTNKNGNYLDCRKDNLIVTTLAELTRLRRSNKGASSNYKGVSWDKNRKKWMVKVGHKGKEYYVGRFNDEEEAAIAYNAKAKKLFGDACYQNVIGQNNESYVREKSWDSFVQRKRAHKPNGYRGISFSEQRNKWIANISINNKTKNLGGYNTDKEAAKAYDKKAFELYGEKTILNFPELINEYQKEIDKND